MTEFEQTTAALNAITYLPDLSAMFAHLELEPKTCVERGDVIFTYLEEGTEDHNEDIVE